MKKYLIIATILTFATLGFSVQNRLEITQPNSGTLTYGKYFNIQWNSNFNDMLDIFIFRGTTEVGKIAVNVPASKHLFRWKTGFLFRKGSVHGQGYKIKIVAKSKHLMDMSNNFFTLIFVY